MNMFDSGRLDAVNDLPSTEIKVLSKRPDYYTKGVIGIYYYGFNTSKPPFDNPKVRKAVSMAVDRKQITDLMAGGEIPLTAWVPQGMMGHTPDVGIKPDVSQAQKLLDEAGYKDRSKFPKVTIGFPTNENHQRIAANVQAQLKQNLGIEVQLSNEEWKTYLQTVRVDAPQIFRLGWLADYPDPDNFMSLMTSYSSNNHTKWGSKKYDELVNKAVSLTDQAARSALYREAQQILTEAEVPVIPIYTMVTQQLISPRLKNYPVNSMKEYRFSKVSFEETKLQ
jgi:oligopeptide transport system substrate-binding protein